MGIVEIGPDGQAYDVTCEVRVHDGQYMLPGFLDWWRLYGDRKQS